VWLVSEADLVCASSIRVCALLVGVYASPFSLVQGKSTLDRLLPENDSRAHDECNQ
jgi:hypothetical protein